MASKALTCSAASAAMVATKGANSSNLPSGFLPRSISFPSSSPAKKDSSRTNSSMVVKAAQDRPESAHIFHHNPWFSHRPALIDSPPYVRTPWGHSVTDKDIVMSFDMPGVDASELEVTILGDELNIMFKGPKDKVDALGRKITGLYDTKIQLPPYCLREQAEAEFRNGILYVRIPRIFMDRTVPIYVPVRAAV